MPGKRARKHFSQLSEFERGLIIGMKTAGWSTRRVDGQVDRSECAVRDCWEQWTREGTHARKTGSEATRKTTRREDRRILWQALVDPTVTRSTIRADVGIATVPQTISRHLVEANLKSSALSVHSFNTRTSATASKVVPNQINVECQRLAKVVFSDESRFVLGTDDNRVRVWRRPRAIFQQDNALPNTARVAQDFLRFSDSSMAGPLPRFVPCKARVGSAKTADAIVSLST
ncbi:transposable element Tc1 transposase [Trichonephila clavipes]|nr:transposable element Tc1 transposase [Trichonephila clavipes]